MKNDDNINTNIIYGEYIDKTPGITIFEHEEFSEKVSFNPIITYFTNLCQSLFEESSQPQNIILTFDVPLNRKVKVKYLNNFIEETKSEIKNNYISQTFTITNPIEDEIIKVFPTDDEEDYKEFKIEFSKNYFEFEEEEVTISEYDSMFDLTLKSTSSNLMRYLKE